MANAYWGPYLPNRDWGTVRKDTSVDGNRFKAILHDNIVKILLVVTRGKYGASTYRTL